MKIYSIAMVVLFVIVFALAMWKGRQFLKWPLKYRLGLALGFAAAMFVWIFLAHRDHDKHEVTVMYVCWDIEGNGQYPKGLDEKSTACPNPERFSWALHPKTVYFDTEHGRFDDYNGSFDEAIKFWNKMLDRDALKIVLSEEMADISIKFGPVDGAEAGAARHVKTGNTIKAFITLTRPTDVSGEYAIIAHELGHAAFGLAHDAGGSIMNEVSMSDVMYLVTEPDKQAIRDMLDGK